MPSRLERSGHEEPRRRFGLSRVFNINGSQFLTLFGTALIINIVTALGAVLLDSIAGGILISLVSIVIGALYGGM